MKDILHITRDSLFIDTAHRIFEEAVPGRSDYILFSNKTKLKNIKSTPIKKFNFFIKFNKNKLKQICSQYRIIIFHALKSTDFFILKSLPNESMVVWLGWGYDYYDLIEKDLLKPLTRSIHYEPSETLFQKARSLIERMLFTIPNRTETPFHRAMSSIVRILLTTPKKLVINRVDYISVFHEEYLLMKKSLPYFRPRNILWTYGSLEDDLIKGFEGSIVNGKNILLGNNAGITNNHLDAFELLKSIDLNERKIITPLSYGDALYCDEIIKQGKSFFGDKFVPVIDFLPIGDYVKMISSCSVVIMNHLRQQAVGNIVIMLYLGAKVFLDPGNPVYSFFRKQSAFIYTLDELKSEIDSMLKPDQIELNRSILRKNWSREVILQKTRNLIELAEK